MQINVGKLSFGLRANTTNWRNYILPKETQGKQHPYFKFGIWWLGFYLYYPKKCPVCKKWMPKSGGIQQYDDNGKFIKVACRVCDNKY